MDLQLVAIMLVQYVELQAIHTIHNHSRKWFVKVTRCFFPLIIHYKRDSLEGHKKHGMFPLNMMCGKQVLSCIWYEMIIYILFNSILGKSSHKSSSRSYYAHFQNIWSKCYGNIYQDLEIIKRLMKILKKVGFYLCNLIGL